MSDFIRYKTSSPAGDLISFMAGIRQLWKDTGKKGIVYQRLGMIGGGMPESVHPFNTEDGQPICMNKYMFDFVKPLIESQEYIESFEIFAGQEYDYDFDLVRQDSFTNQPRGSLNRWPFYVFPEMTCDLSEAWVLVDSNWNPKIILNFTGRYRNQFVNYFFLKKHQDDIIFAGLQSERDDFCNKWGLDIPLLEVKNALELCSLISSCRFFIGNQSFCFQLAEATKWPRILEIFQLMPNVIPIGKNAHDFYSQKNLEYSFNKFYNESKTS